MQQDKFKRADECMEVETPAPESESSASPGPSSILSPDKRRGSAAYWRDKFQQAIGIIDELHEKSIQLTEIPDFMTVQKLSQNYQKKMSGSPRYMVQ